MINLDIGSSIRYNRNLKQLSLDELSKSSGLSKTFLSQIENNKKTPTIDTLIKIANALNIKIYQLIGEKEEEYSEELKKLINNAKDLDKKQISLIISIINEFNKIKKHTYDELSFVAEVEKPYNAHIRTIPILGYVAAGKPIELIENVLGETETRLKDADFALYIKGDSMEPVIHNGDMVYVHKVEDAENGEIIVAYYNNEVTCKKLYKHNGIVELKPINDKYDPIIINKGDFKMIGKVLI